MDPKNPAIRLFISDLPETTDAMIPGGVYAMIADTPPARFPVLATSLAGAVASGNTASLLVATPPKTFIDRLSQVGFSSAEDALDTGRFQVFQLQEDFNKKMFRFGAEAFLRELDHFHLPAHSYLLIDQADELLSLHDISLALEQAETLGLWARKLKITVLLVFTRVAAVPASMATLTGLMDYLSGIARLGGSQDGLDLTFEYWQSPDSTIAAKVFGLTIREDGRYKIKTETVSLTEPLASAASITPASDTVEPEEAADHLRYLYVDPSLSSLSSQVQGIWQACDSVMGIIRAAFGAKAPTVLLVFERHTELRSLAEAVHTLRLSLGRRARIVVIERDASLRYQNEILLLRLGTSLVVHRDVQENRIPLMLESLRGQVFNREIEMNFDAALSSVAASAKRGYLPPASFVREAASIVDRAELLNLPCAMVLATPVNGKTCTELLTKVRVGRSGDLTTTDGQHCVIFFSGCPENSTKQALHALLGNEVEQLLVGMQFVTTRSDIRQQLAAISQAIEGKTFPDSIVDATQMPSVDSAYPIDLTTKAMPIVSVTTAVPLMAEASVATPKIESEQSAVTVEFIAQTDDNALVKQHTDLTLHRAASETAQYLPPTPTAVTEIEIPLLRGDQESLPDSAIDLSQKPVEVPPLLVRAQQTTVTSVLSKASAPPDNQALQLRASVLSAETLPQRKPIDMPPPPPLVHKLRRAVRRVAVIDENDPQTSFDSTPESSSRV